MPGESLHRRTRNALDELGVRPRRRLGQNFLVAEHVIEKIVGIAAPQGRTVVEIGPGTGALSDALAAAAAHLYLIEIDAPMAKRLAERYASTPNVDVVTADALVVDFHRLLSERAPAVAVGNLPYSVASQILLRLIEARGAFERLVLMLQREVAERLVARPGTREYGTLTLWTALYGEAKIALRVLPGAFVPRPKVESAVVTVRLASEPRVHLEDEGRFREIVRRSFGQRRKTLRAALSGFTSAAQIERAGIEPGRRGETLSLAEFATLASPPSTFASPAFDGSSTKPLCGRWSAVASPASSGAPNTFSRTSATSSCG
jgi:16S rRNA (adenine1518-N6/adenine1519-N6)-dimethyltransferase